MTKFVILINYPGDDIAQIKDLPERLASGREGAGAQGITLESYYLTFGRFDAVAIIDAPDGPTAARFVLNMIGVGKVRTETMTAFSDDQIDAIAGGVLE